MAGKRSSQHFTKFEEREPAKKQTSLLNRIFSSESDASDSEASESAENFQMRLSMRGIESERGAELYEV